MVSIWFEKKQGQDSIVLVPSIASGPVAAFIQSALGSLDIPVDIVDSAEELLFQLVRKNVYILTTNIAGLETGGTVSELWANHEALARDVAHEVILIQQALTGQEFNEDALIKAMLVSFDGDPNHKCMGRSAPSRLQRALDTAAQYSLQLPTLQKIAAEHL